MDPTNSTTIKRKYLYSPVDKKKNQTFRSLLHHVLEKNNSTAKNVVDYLERQYDHKLKAVPYSGNCLFNAILEQISHSEYMYNATILRQQTAYYLAKFLKKFWYIIKEFFVWWIIRVIHLQLIWWIQLWGYYFCYSHCFNVECEDHHTTTYSRRNQNFT